MREDTAAATNVDLNVLLMIEILHDSHSGTHRTMVAMAVYIYIYVYDIYIYTYILGHACFVSSINSSSGPSSSGTPALQTFLRRLLLNRFLIPTTDYQITIFFVGYLYIYIGLHNRNLQKSLFW